MTLAKKYKARFGVAIVAMLLTLAGCSGDEDNGNPVGTLTETVTTPNIPAADRRIHPLTEGVYATGGSVSSMGHPLEYRFDFDGSVTQWSQDSLASHTWGTAGRHIVRAQSRCALHDVLSPWTLNVLILAHGHLVTDFETPVLGPDTARVVNPYSNDEAGVTFSTDEPGFNLGHVGLVLNRSTTACVAPKSDNQKLGTGRRGTGQVGWDAFEIRADFLPYIPPGATLRVQVQIRQLKDVKLTVFSPQHRAIAVVTKNAGVGAGTCGYFGEPRTRVTLEYTASQDVKLIRIDGGSFDFVIDNFEIDIPQR